MMAVKRKKVGTLTKAERIASARKVRAYLAKFTSFQSGHMREFIRSEWGRDPDYTAMNELLFAQRELSRLIRDLRAEGYGGSECHAD